MASMCCMEETAEVINQYFKKGNQIYIEGSLESRSWRGSKW